MGIRGNEKADETAKSALSLPESNYKVPYTDFKTSVLTYTQSFWQSQWDTGLFNKLHCETNPWRVVPLLQIDPSRRGDNYETSNWTLLFNTLLAFSQRGCTRMYSMQ